MEDDSTWEAGQAAQAAEKLQRQLEGVSAEAQHALDRLDDWEEVKGREVEERTAALAEELEAVTDERDDLLERIRFLERQFVRFRWAARSDSDKESSHQVL